MILEHLGDVYRDLDDRQSAHEKYRRALELSPDSESLQLKVEQTR